MPEKKIVVTVQPDGTVKHDFIGYVGADCTKVAEALKQQLAALGIQSETIKFEPKPELIHSQEAYRPQQSGQKEASNG
jgi:hypothetical protein